MNQDDVFSHPYIDNLFFLQVDIAMHLKVHESEAPRHECYVKYEGSSDRVKNYIRLPVATRRQSYYTM